MEKLAIFALALSALAVSSAASAGRYHVLYQFRATADNEQPATLTIGRDGSLYGTTAPVTACIQNCGVLFQIAPDGTYSTRYSFPGGQPTGDLVADRAGNFYIGNGVVSEIAPDGSETTLHTFAGETDGLGPRLSVRTKAGDLYGVTNAGGNDGCDGAGCGTIFKIASTGEFSVLHSFTYGDQPGRIARDKDGNLFGATLTGGVNGDGCSDVTDYEGCGTIFKLEPDGTMTTLYTFLGSGDGSAPVLQFIGKHGDLYGTTTGNGPGTVFKVAPNGTKTVLHVFTGGVDGSAPSSLIEGSRGNLFGATLYGGEPGSCHGKGCGVIFKLAPNGDMSILHAFEHRRSGSHPVQIVLSADGGKLYGITAAGPCKRGTCGTAFALSLR